MTHDAGFLVRQKYSTGKVRNNKKYGSRQMAEGRRKKPTAYSPQPIARFGRRQKAEGNKEKK